MTENHHPSQTPAENAPAAAHDTRPAPPEFPPPHPAALSPDATMKVLEDGILRAEETLADFWNMLHMDTNMTGRERLRLIGVKSRNYGFINKAYAIAQENPNFRPGNFWLEDMTKELEILEKARQLSLVVDQLKAVTDDFQLQTSDRLYRFALRIYGNLREQARAGVAGAKALFAELLQFFTLRRRRPGEAAPTEHELELDYKRLIHGHADGELLIKNESPHLTGGVHEVVDDVRKHGRHEAEIKVKSEE